MTKEVLDALDAIPAVPIPMAVEPPAPLPAAPVDQLRNRLNKSIAHANGAAGAFELTR